MRNRHLTLKNLKLFAAELGKSLQPGSVVAFFGGLGSGKTTCVQAIVEARLGKSWASSPTFSYLHLYEEIYHFDLYRLRGEEEFLQMGFDDYFSAGGICLIEWAERIEALLPPDSKRIYLEHAGDKRRVSIM